ncbi:fibronectin type III domain-containing protein [Paenibacillus sp. PastF-3]|uniref:fibronectin type III domain-containing protein n=1 Tax=Paenibacillus sp. PastF-3 TaxID=2940626 RepID=UPI0024752894|nr:fibronectin type III domain-containing protein [Paenibacillus sp. PastF-3]
MKAEGSKLQADVTAARTLVNALNASEKTPLSARLDTVQAAIDYAAKVTAATAAVVKAEGSKLQVDVTAARTLVNVLNASEKTPLSARLDTVQAAIDYAAKVTAATAAVVKAEGSKLQVDVTAARTLVDALNTADKAPLIARLDTVQAAIDYAAKVTTATAAVVKAEGSKLQVDVTAARTLVNALNASDKATLGARLDAVQAAIDYAAKVATATAAVVKAEGTRLQADVTSARTLVDALNTAEKTPLIARLDTVQAAIDYAAKVTTATAAVVKAEGSRLQVDVTSARTLVNALNASDKASLGARLDTVQAAIDYAAKVTAATAAVVKAEGSKLQVDVTAARTLVNALNASDKTPLSARLDTVQAAIDYAAQVATATAAVVKAEGTKLQVDVTAARTLVNALNASDKATLGARLDTVQAAIDYAAKVTAATAAVVKAEGSKLQVDVTAARTLVNALNASDKTPLSARLDTIQAAIDYAAQVATATAAVVKAEGTKLQVDVTAARTLVNALNASDKATLGARLDTVQAAIDYAAKVATATAAVVKAEGTRLQADVTSARTLVDALNTAEKTPLIARLDTVQAAIDYAAKVTAATAAVVKAEGSKLQVDVTAARTLVNALNASDKTPLSARLDTVQAAIDYAAKVTAATAAVVKAEGSKLQADVTSARTLVDALNTTDKAPLNTRLDIVQAAIDYATQVTTATAAVVKAEGSKLQADVNVARTLVNALNASDKSTLGARLDTVQAGIDYGTKVTAATAAVVKAEGSKLQADVTSARTLVDALSTTDKASLNARLDIVQAAIDYAARVTTATAAVVKAEGSKLQVDVTSARTLVNALNTSDKTPLSVRLDAVQAAIDYAAQVTAATAAVVKAEGSKLQVDVTAARTLVNALNTSDKTPLSTRLDTVQAGIDYAAKVATATAAVVKAEGSKLQVDVTAARTLVNALNASEKTPLNTRLDAVQAGIDYAAKVATATAAVVKAEGTKLQADVTSARTLVDALNTAEKNPLIARLDTVQAAIDYAAKVTAATAAVVKAEGSKLQVDVTAARTLVNALNASDKTPLSARLDTVQAAIDYAAKVTAATAAVVKAEGSRLQADVTNARNLVDALNTAEKTPLIARLDIVQAAIDYAAKVAAATAAVVKAEGSRLQVDVTAARTLVNALNASEKTPLNARLDIVQAGIDYAAQVTAATAAVVKAEGSKLQVDVTAARTLVNALNVSEKTPLSARLDTVQAGIDYAAKVATATAAVVKAEGTKLQVDVTAARTLVNALNASDKTPLNTRLDTVQAGIDYAAKVETATAAVVKAEGSRLQADVTSARTLVDALNTADKTPLITRLDTVQAAIDYAAKVTAATAAVVKAEGSKLQVDVTAARTLVNALNASDKTPLSARLDTVQAAIDYSAQFATATAAVVKAEGTKLQVDVTAARTLVNALNASDKATLGARLDTVQAGIDYAAKVATATAAVVKAEGSRLQADVTSARTLVDALNTADKTPLIARLDTVQVAIDYAAKVATATAAVVKAEGSKLQVDVTAARTLVNALNASEKTPLSARLDTVQAAIDYSAQVATATAAVLKAEGSKLQVDVTAARTLVNALNASEKTPLNARLDTVQAAIDYAAKVTAATAAVVKAEGSKLQVDVTAARTLVNALNASDKTPLSTRLDAVQVAIDYSAQVTTATVAVVKAEGSKLQVDVTAARTLVNALNASDKATLGARLDTVQAAIDYAAKVTAATAAVVKAEGSRLQADVTSARTLVDALNTADKTPLNSRLDTVQAAIDYAAKVTAATAAVVKAEGSLLQDDVDAARTLVNALNSVEKDTLNSRLSKVQEIVDYNVKVRAATTAVDKAESTKLQVDINAARILVNDLHTEDKDALNTRLDGIQKAVDYLAKVKKATDAVVKAEESKLQADVTAARSLVGALNEAEKTELNSRLDAIQEGIDYNAKVKIATAAVEKAEDTFLQTDVTAARVLVNGLKGIDKTSLTERLDAVQEIIDSTTSNQAATQAVLKAEVSKSQSDVNTARALVDQLKDLSMKDKLNQRLDAVQKLLDYSDLIGQAYAAVIKAEGSEKAEDVAAALALIEKLDEGTLKNALSSRLNVVQAVVNAVIANQLKFDEARAAVQKAAENTNNVTYTAARDLVNQLPASNAKNELVEQLQAILVKLSEGTAISEATQAVLKAETSKTLADYKYAIAKVNPLNSSDQKTSLEGRLASLKETLDLAAANATKLIDAKVAVEGAERLKTQEAINLAKTLVDALNTGAEKTNLLNRLKVVQDSLTSSSMVVTNLGVTNQKATSLRITWTAPANVTTFKVERVLNGTVEKTVSLVSSSDGYSDTGLKEKTEYEYRITVKYGTLSGEPVVYKVRTLAEGETPPVEEPKPQPTDPAMNVSGFKTKTQTKNSITLEWTKVPGAIGYRLERVNEDGIVEKTVNLSTVSSYNDSSLDLNTTNTYRLAAKNKFGAFGEVSIIQASTLQVEVPPAPSITQLDVDGEGVLHFVGQGTEGYNQYMVIKKASGVQLARLAVTNDIEKTYVFNLAGDYTIRMETYNSAEKVSSYSATQTVTVATYMVEAPIPQDLQATVEVDGNYNAFTSSVINDVNGLAEKYSFEVYDPNGKKIASGIGKVIGDRIVYTYKKSITTTVTGTYTIKVRGKHGASTYGEYVTSTVEVQ